MWSCPAVSASGVVLPDRGRHVVQLSAGERGGGPAGLRVRGRPAARGWIGRRDRESLRDPPLRRGGSSRERGSRRAGIRRVPARAQAGREPARLRAFSLVARLAATTYDVEPGAEADPNDGYLLLERGSVAGACVEEPREPSNGTPDALQGPPLEKIGRASCRKECRSRWSPYH